MSFGGKDLNEAFNLLYGAANAVVENRSATSAATESAKTPDANKPIINIAELLKSIPVFKKGDNLFNFVSEVDRLFDKISETLTPDICFLINAFIITHKLKGEPRYVCKGEVDWPGIKRVLLQKYGDTNQEGELKKMLTQCVQKIGESYLDFYCNILKTYSSLLLLVTLYSNDLSEARLKGTEYNKLAIKTFKNGLLDPYKEYLSRFDLLTLDECIEKCKVLYKIKYNSVELRKSQDSLPLPAYLSGSNFVKPFTISQRSKSRIEQPFVNGYENRILTIADRIEIPDVNGKEIFLKLNNSMVADDTQEKIYFLKKDGDKIMGLTEKNTIIIFNKGNEINTMEDGIVSGTEIHIKKNPPIKEDLKYERVRVIYSKGGQVMGLSEDNRLVLTRDKDKINVDHFSGVSVKFIYLKIDSPWMRNPQYEKVRVIFTGRSSRHTQAIIGLTEDFRVILCSVDSEIKPDDLPGFQDINKKEIFIRRKSVIHPQYERIRVFFQEGNVIFGTTEDNRVIVTGIQNANKLINDPDSPFPSAVMTFKRTSDICISHCLKYCEHIADLLSGPVDHDTSMDAQKIENGRQESDQIVARNSAQTVIKIQTDELPDVKDQYIYVTRNTSMMSDDIHKMYFVKEEGGKILGLTKDSRVVIIDEKHAINTYGDDLCQCHEIYIKIPPMNKDLMFDRIRVFYSKGGNILGLSEDNRVVFMSEKEKFNHDGLQELQPKLVFVNGNSPWMREPQYEKIRYVHATWSSVGLTEDFRVITDSLREISSENVPKVQNDEIFIKRDIMVDPQYERIRVLIQEGNVILGTTDDKRFIVTGIQNAKKLINDPDSPFASTVMTFNRTSEICVSHCLKYFSEFLSFFAKPTI